MNGAHASAGRAGRFALTRAEAEALTGGRWVGDAAGVPLSWRRACAQSSK